MPLMEESTPPGSDLPPFNQLIELVFLKVALWRSPRWLPYSGFADEEPGSTQWLTVLGRLVPPVRADCLGAALMRALAVRLDASHRAAIEIRVTPDGEPRIPSLSGQPSVPSGSKSLASAFCSGSWQVGR